MACHLLFYSSVSPVRRIACNNNRLHSYSRPPMRMNAREGGVWAVAMTRCRRTSTTPLTLSSWAVAMRATCLQMLLPGRTEELACQRQFREAVVAKPGGWRKNRVTTVLGRPPGCYTRPSDASVIRTRVTSLDDVSIEPRTISRSAMGSRNAKSWSRPHGFERWAQSIRSSDGKPSVTRYSSVLSSNPDKQLKFPPEH